MYLLGLQRCCFGTLESFCVSAFLQASNWPVQGKNLHGNSQHTNTNTGHETLASSLCPHMLVMAETLVDKARKPFSMSQIKEFDRYFQTIISVQRKRCSRNTRPGFLSFASPFCCFPPFLIPFLLPEFFSSADLQCTPFNGPLPPSERRPLSSPPPSLPPRVSHSLFLPRSHRQHLPRLPSLFTSVNSVAQRGWLSLMNSLFSLQPGADF